jgi:hypothetical protein
MREYVEGILISIDLEPEVPPDLCYGLNWKCWFNRPVFLQYGFYSAGFYRELIIASTGSKGSENKEQK